MLLKLTVKSNGVWLISLAVVLSVCQAADAQLNVGKRKVQRGLEREYLQYQLGQRNLSDALVIPSCTIGSGTGCNKTGSVLQQLIAVNGGPNYYDLVIRAAGGQQNYQNFAAFYGNNRRLPEIPYASFWKRESPLILDGYQYVLGQSVGRSPVPGLGSVTKNFAWVRTPRGDNSVSPRQGLIDFKHAFGHELLVEVAKIPNLEQQVRALDLPPDMTQFYLNNLSRGLNALNTGNGAELQESILRIVSFPYSSTSVATGDAGRVPLGIPEELDNIEGTPIVGEALSPDVAILEPEAFFLEPDTAIALDVGTVAGSSFNLLPFAAPLPLLLLLLLGEDDGGSSTSAVASSPPNPPTVPPDDGGTSGGGTNPPPIRTVDEPSTLTAILLMTPVLCLFSYKQRFVKVKSCFK